jgi:hypothetical protein
MKNDNPLNNFTTGKYSSGFKDVPTTPTICPTLGQATANPLKLIDYIGCHKILMILVLAVISLLFYSGVKAKVAAEGGAGAKGAGGPAKK